MKNNYIWKYNNITGCRFRCPIKSIINTEDININKQYINKLKI